MFNFEGSDLHLNNELGILEQWYCRLLGVPIVGLRIRVRIISKLLPDTAKEILDAGCGRGVISRYLARRYSRARVTAIDSDSHMQEINERIAKRSGLLNCAFEVADLNEYQKRNTFDLIVSVDNLEHIEDDVSVLMKLYDSLVPGGSLVIHVPHYYRRWPVFEWRENFNVPGHYRPGYHLPQLTERLQKVGFAIDRSGFSYGFLENIANNVSYWITGARERNKILYALLFPLLNIISYLGQWQVPRMGAGVWAIAIRPPSLAVRNREQI